MQHKWCWDMAPVLGSWRETWKWAWICTKCWVICTLCLRPSLGPDAQLQAA